MNIKINSSNLSQNMNPIYSRAHSLLDKMGNITPQSEQQVPYQVQKFLLDNTPKRMKELAKLNCYAASKVKSELDKEFGEGKYVVIAIGRSVSSIAELMGHMGVDVKIIPLSGLRQGLPDFFPEKDMQAYGTFLAKKGLSKYDLQKNSEKTYILMDYAFYGRSLERAKKLLKNYELLGNVKNLITKSINEILGDDFKTKHFDILFEYNRFKNYSYVGKLNVNNLVNVFNSCSPDVIKEYQRNMTQGIRKLFWFNVCHFFNNNNYKDVNPTEEVKALYKHYLSMEAIRRYINREQNKVIKLKE